MSEAYPVPRHPESTMYARSLLFILLIVPCTAAQEPSPDLTRLTLDRIFASGEFHGERLPAVKWLDGGAYTTLQPSEVHKKANDIVRYDATGKSDTEHLPAGPKP